MDNSIKIHFRDLRDMSTDDEPEYRHIHGYLGIEIHGRIVPYIGYAGMNDACFNDWIAVLLDLKHTVIQRSNDHIIYDEHEEEQPAFFFEIEEDGTVISFSIIQSASGEGADDPEWQQIRFSYQAFELALENFRKHFMEWIGQRAHESYRFWSEEWE